MIAAICAVDGDTIETLVSWSFTPTNIAGVQAKGEFAADNRIVIVVSENCCVRLYTRRLPSHLARISHSSKSTMAMVSGSQARNFPEYEVPGAKKVHFSPYADNGGSVIALAGNDFSVIAADTRLSTGFSICTRDQQKLFNLSETTVLGCSGCWCDVLTLTRVLAARMQMYKHEHQKDMTTPATAQMLSTVLYYKRFFPYYVSNVLAGLDESGKGCIYSYDPIGHCEKANYRAGGSAGALLQPLLDNQVGLKNQEGAEVTPLTQERAVAIIKDVFISAAERDIYTGDGISIKIITKDGVKTENFALRKD